jgi:nucleotide-binding universal stress UspA family protein
MPYGHTHSPASGVLSRVKDGDLLVLGSHGRGALKTGLFGSTVNSVLDHVTVSVAIVPHASNG